MPERTLKQALEENGLTLFPRGRVMEYNSDHEPIGLGPVRYTLHGVGDKMCYPSWVTIHEVWSVLRSLEADLDSVDESTAPVP